MTPEQRASLLARTDQAIAERVFGVGSQAGITRDLWLLRELREVLLDHVDNLRRTGDDGPHHP